jgi:hypothetical protein
MIRDLLLLLPYGIVAGMVWFGRTYLARRVEEAARGAVDIAVGERLATYKHGLDLQLEAHRSAIASQAEEARRLVIREQERFSRDYSLYAEERNRAYAATYAEFEKAFGAFARHFADITVDRDFSRSPDADLRDLAARLEHISAAERASLLELLDMKKIREAGALGTRLFKKDALRQANYAYSAFRNATILNSLYLSRAVTEQLERAAELLAPLTVFADELIEEERIDYRDRRVLSSKIKELRERGADLRVQMRTEMQSGFHGPPDPSV